MNKTIVDALNWRYAVKKFDPEKKVSLEDFNTILEAGHLAPSSLGLQPWKFIVVENSETRKVLATHVRNQSQVVDSTYYVLLAIPKTIDTQYVDQFIAYTAKVQNRTIESLTGMKESITKLLASKATDAELQAWLAKQAYITLGIMVETAALLGVDACPMESINKEKFADILGTDALGLNLIAAFAVGYRASDDPAATRAKVRFPLEDMVMRIK